MKPMLAYALDAVADRAGIDRKVLRQLAGAVTRLAERAAWEHDSKEALARRARFNTPWERSNNA